ncbi:uncharacterized protein TNCV_3613001 [Trichonephila clavipes]|uniref:Uncharacterized protein n=1 Tax=Trichonephila clavipes TaxID=2585209 RepID=A0A8X6SIQ8_TRICX|nr:uncharacterized protein TNCV_3613001 [Trichonephila clavipes]
MAPGSRCISKNTCGCRMSLTYRCHGSILGVTVYCRQWHPIPSHQLGERCVAVKQKVGFWRSPRGLHTRTRLPSLLRLNLDSSLKTTWFYSAAIQFPRARHHSKRRSRWVGVKDITRNRRRDPKYPSARHLRMVQEDTGAPVKVLPGPGWKPMKQQAVRVLFLQCGGLLGDWSVEGVLSLVFV